MTQDYCLYYVPDNASLCIRIALEELGLPYTTRLVDRSTGAHKSPDYLALNPNGLIPVLQTPDGPLFETAAILLWLARQTGRLMPTGGADEMHSLQWMVWLANTLHPSLRMMFYPEQYSDGDPASLRQMAGRRLRTHLDILQAADTAPWLDDTEPSVMGCYLGPMLRWAALYGGGADWFDLTDWPRLFAFAQWFEQRDSVIEAATAEGLGPTPFSRATPCTKLTGV